MSENQSKMYTVWTAHHGQSGSIHVVDGDVLLIINDLTRQYLHPDTADSLATVFREAARDARSQRHDGGWPAMTDEEVRAMNRTVNDLVRRVFALERARCTESEPDSEDAPMTPEEEWADVGLEGEWEHDGLPFEYWALRDEIEVNPRDADRAEWRVFGQHCDVYAPTLRDAVASARECAPADLRRYLWPRDEWRTFGECEPEEGQWIEVDNHWACDGPGVMRHGDSPCTPSADVLWRPFSPPETSCPAQGPEVGTADEIAELRARLAQVEAERDRARDEERDRIVRLLRSRGHELPARVVELTKNWKLYGGEE